MRYGARISLMPTFLTCVVQLWFLYMCAVCAFVGVCRAMGVTILIVSTPMGGQGVHLYISKVMIGWQNIGYVFLHIFGAANSIVLHLEACSNWRAFATVKCTFPSATKVYEKWFPLNFICPHLCAPPPPSFCVFR